MRVTMRAARINAGLTLETAAKPLKVTAQTVFNWEKGATEPTISQAYAMADLYNTTIDDIIFFESQSD